ncbi:hypothetical protein TSOC_013837, partial [Tetrabaena socialis]
MRQANAGCDDDKTTSAAERYLLTLADLGLDLEQLVDKNTRMHLIDTQELRRRFPSGLAKPRHALALNRLSLALSARCDPPPHKEVANTFKSTRPLPRECRQIPETVALNEMPVRVPLPLALKQAEITAYLRKCSPDDGEHQTVPGRPRGSLAGGATTPAGANEQEGPQRPATNQPEGSNEQAAAAASTRERTRAAAQATHDRPRRMPNKLRKRRQHLIDTETRTADPALRQNNATPYEAPSAEKWSGRRKQPNPTRITQLAEEAMNTQGAQGTARNGGRPHRDWRTARAAALCGAPARSASGSATSLHQLTYNLYDDMDEIESVIAGPIVKRQHQDQPARKTPRTNRDVRAAEEEGTRALRTTHRIYYKVSWKPTVISQTALEAYRAMGYQTSSERDACHRFGPIAGKHLREVTWCPSDEPLENLEKAHPNWPAVLAAFKQSQRSLQDEPVERPSGKDIHLTAAQRQG